MKILSFGHIPTWAGGRQESGLANVIYQLAYHISQKNTIDLALAATDVYKKVLQKDNLKIIGWTKRLLLCYAMLHPWIFLKALFLSAYYSLKYHGVVNMAGLCMKMIFLRYSIDKTNPAIVHLHGMGACLYLKMVPRTMKIIVTIHGVCGGDVNLSKYQEMRKLEYTTCHSNRISKIVFIAEGVRQGYLELYGEIVPQSAIILNAYDGNAFFFIEHNKLDVLSFFTVASLSERKGQQRVLEGLAKSGKKYRYSCIGAGSKEMVSQLEQYATTQGIPFTYYGKRKPEEIRKLLAQADYMIMPSSSEGFGLTYLEAMACGVPVILPRDLPIVKEKGIICPGVNAILLEDCSAESIAQCFLNIENYKFNRKEVANSVLSYTWDKIAEQYVSLINQELNNVS